MLKSNNLSNSIDKTDIQILQLLTEDYSNKRLSSMLKIPLSTVQRRVRKLIDKGFIVSKNQIDFTKFGFKSGSIHIYLDNGNMNAILDKVSKFQGVTSLEVHIGNSDIIAEIIYKHGRDLLNIITAVKKLEGVERIVWSEFIYGYPIPSNKTSFLELGQ